MAAQGDTKKKAATKKKSSTKKASSKKAGAKKSATPQSAAEGSAKPEVDDDVLEFIEALDRYKAESGKPFPAWSEVLFVVKSLGYTKS